MVGIYARQSVDKKDSISIETQLAECKRVAGDKPYKTYADKGYSGKNTDRPQFQAMMQDIRSGLIDCVVVYKLDRISRSLLDFASMTEEFERYHVSFISCNESFDTSQPMGKATLNMCMVFAQLERETIQQRVVDAYMDRSKKGFYMGGPVPYGFTVQDVVIDGIHTKQFVELPEESAHIKIMYEMYADPKYSLGDIIKYFAAHGICHARGKHWATARISDYLKNPVYVQADADVYQYYQTNGTEIITPPELFIGENGCYLYQPRGEGQETGKRTSKFDDKYLVLAPHKGFIPSSLWLRVRKRCAENTQSTRTNKPTRSWLLGKVKCGNCGSRLDVTKSQTKWERYFQCGLQRESKRTACQGTGSTIYAAVLEQEVSERIKVKLSQFDGISHREQTDETNAREINTLKTEINQLNNEIALWVDKIPSANGAVMEQINIKVEELTRKKESLQAALAKMTDDTDTKQLTVLSNLASHWDSLPYEDKQAVVDALIEVIYVKNGEVTVKWRI